ncbi:MAG: secondary thiamine-phosphate synthase enzyme YjbQ [Halanaerobiales bacterium]|nr:secondary thiamine-phosphate synthase enzyme YjbQ [Halanaerobiales bacterium]
MYKSMRVKSSRKNDMVDITDKVVNFINESPVSEGLLVINVLHTTAAVTINENADPDVKKDIYKELSKLIPAHDNYKHIEGNADAHIKTSLVGTNETIIIKNNRLKLGSWQGIFLCDFDGPRTRTVILKIISD